MKNYLVNNQEIDQFMQDCAKLDQFEQLIEEVKTKGFNRKRRLLRQGIMSKFIQLRKQLQLAFPDQQLPTWNDTYLNIKS